MFGKKFNFYDQTRYTVICGINIIVQDCKNVGLKMIVHFSIIASLKATWIKRLINTEKWFLN